MKTAGFLLRRAWPPLLALLAIIAIGQWFSRPIPPARPGTVFYDFENDSQLDHLSWNCGTVFRRVAKHAADGRWSLEITMYPGPNPWPGFGTGFKPTIAPGAGLELALFNPAARPLRLSYRIDDRFNPPYGDRLNGRITLAPGSNRVLFDFSRLKTPGTRRRLRPEKIYHFCLFLHHPDKATVIYLDHLAVAAGSAPNIPETTTINPSPAKRGPTDTGEKNGH